MKCLNVKSLLLGIALLFSVSANAEAAWIRYQSAPGVNAYFYVPIRYDVQYAYTSVWVRFSSPVNINGWRYDARSFRYDVRINCDYGSVKFRRLLAFTKPNLSGYRVSLAYVYVNGRKISPGSTMSYNRLSPEGQNAVNYICG